MNKNNKNNTKDMYSKNNGHKIFREIYAFPMIFSLVFCTMSTVAEQVHAQEANNSAKYEMKTIEGSVVDAATNEALAGAHIQAFNNAGYVAMTDENGKFSIKVPAYVTSLYATYPNANDVQISISNNETPVIKMYSDCFNSYYSNKIEISSKKTIAINNTSATAIDEEIENKLSGDIRTINRGGIAGMGAAMFIRGINSLNINANPLVIVDGIIIDMQYDRTASHDGFFNNILATIDPEDIESVSVLKNATSLYGSRGSNGVVIIKTRRGHSMATKINVSIFGGVETQPTTMKMLDGEQYRNYVSQIIGTTKYGQKYSTVQTSIPFLNEDKNYYWYPLFHNNTDWSKDLYKSALTQNYKINVQGGDEVAMYNLSLGYTNSEATAKNNTFDRLSIRFNTDINIIKNVSTQFDLAYNRTTRHLLDNGWAESYADGPISSPNVLGEIQAPFLSKYEYYTGPDLKLHQSRVLSGKYSDDSNNPFYFASKYGTNVSFANPYWILENGFGDNKNYQEVNNFHINVMPRWDITKNLYVANRFAYMFNRTSEKYFLPQAGVPIFSKLNTGNITDTKKSIFNKETSLFNDFQIHWKNRYGMHDIELTGGFRFTSNTFTDSYIIGYNGGSDKMPDNRQSDQYPSIKGTDDSWKNMAYYAQADYSIMNKYFIQAGFTAETSSRFGKESDGGLNLFGVKWGFFPTLQAGWILTNEKWLSGIKGIDHLKLTVGVDVTGNDNFDYFASRTYFTAQSFLKEGIGLQLANLENSNIKWETTTRWNFALNGSFLNNRLQAGIDFFVSNTYDLQTWRANNYISGLKGYYDNNGSLRNKGIEANFNAILINNWNFKWQFGASLGHYKNMITYLPNIIINKVYDGEIYIKSNAPIGQFYGYQTAGVFSSDEEAKTAGKSGYLKYPTGLKNEPYRNFEAGDMRFVDRNNDGIINESDKTIIGDANPDIYGNMFSKLTYKHWTLDLSFKFSAGNDIYNYNRRQLESQNNFYNQTQATLNRWTYEGQVTNMPRACSSESETSWVDNERFSDRWIEDGSYFKCKKIRLTYELPLTLSWLQGITVWGEVNNVFTLSKYTGSDPETSCSNNIMYQGIDTGMLPSDRSFNLGVKINL